MSQSTFYSGDLLVDRLNDDGTSNGFADSIEVSKLQMKQDTETKKQTSTGRDTYGQTIAAIAVPGDNEITLTIASIDRNTLSMALMGESSDESVGADTITDELVVAKLGHWVDLEKRNLVDGSVTITGCDEGVDYAVNYRLGMIKALPGGTIAHNATVSVSYSTAAWSGFKITPAVRPSIKVRLRMDGKDLADGSSVIVDIDEAIIAPTSPLDWKAKEFQGLEFSGSMRTLPGKKSPYVVTKMEG